MRISVVINTLNRSRTIWKTLESFRFQDHKDFEIIVVNGPSIDNTEEIVAQFSDVKYVKCPLANLSVSRNIGIEHSAGDIVVFVDDDAFATRDFLSTIAAGYTDSDIAGVGTLVYGPNGRDYQMVPFFVDWLAEPHFENERWNSYYYHHNSPLFGHMVGCSSSFRRESLVKIEGFDENIEYFLDETEVCMRLAERNLNVIITGGRPKIYHVWAEASHRNFDRIITSPRKIIENKYYVVLRNNADKHKALEQCEEYAKSHLEEARKHHREGRLTADQFTHFCNEVEAGRKAGLAKSLEHRGGRALRSLAPFSPFHTFPDDSKRSVVLISRLLAPSELNGIAKFSHDLACSLSEMGRIVRVVTEGDHDYVEFNGKYWIHTVCRRAREFPGQLAPVNHLLSWAYSAYLEVDRIRSEFGVDIVSAPIWDLEGMFVQLSGQFNFVLSLHTNFHEYFSINPGARPRDEIEQLLILEKAHVMNARNFHANSEAIVEKIELQMGIKLSSLGCVSLIPHACAPISIRPRERANTAIKKVLFLSRLEERKGFDVYFEAALLAKCQGVELEFLAAGEDTKLAGSSQSYLESLCTKHGVAVDTCPVVYLGQVSEEAKAELFSSADIFCVPSRFESFGYVYIEAMSAGLPIVAVAAGAATEVIPEDGGVLVATPDPQKILEAIRGLLRPQRGKVARNANIAKFDKVYSTSAWKPRLAVLY